MGNGLDEVKAVADYVTSDLHKRRHLQRIAPFLIDLVEFMPFKMRRQEDGMIQRYIRQKESM